MRRSWLAEALLQDVRSAARWRFQAFVVFRLAPLAVGPFIEPTWRAAGEVGDDEARVDAIGSGLDAGDDPLNPAPAAGAVVELGVAALLARVAGRGIARRGARLERQDMAAQRGGAGHGEDEIQPLGPAEVEHLRRAVVAVGADQDLHPGPVATDLAHRRTPQIGRAHV